MNRTARFFGWIILLLLLCSCSRCISQLESTTVSIPRVTLATTEAKSPIIHPSPTFRPEPTINVIQSHFNTVPAATSEPTATAEPTATDELTIPLLVSTSSPDIGSTMPISTYTLDDFAQLLPRETETRVFLLTTTSTSLSNDQTMHKLWQYTLRDGSYDLVASWPAFGEKSLADSIPKEAKPTIADMLSVNQDELLDMKEQFDPLKVSLSSSGRYLVVGALVRACCFEYDNSWALIRNLIFLLDLETGQTTDIWTAWGDNRGIAALLWSPDGNKLAFEISRRTSDLYVYNLLSSQIEHIGPGEQAVWHSDSRHLSFVSSDSLPGSFRLTTVDIESLETRTLNFPSDVEWLPYAAVDSNGTVKVFYQDHVKTYYKMSSLDDKYTTLHPLTQINDRYLSSPKSNSSGSFIAYESWPNSVDRSLEVLDLRTNKISTLLDMPVYAWEWSSVTDVILARVPGEEPGKAQAAIILVEDRVVITLPQPPNLGEYESITDVTW